MPSGTYLHLDPADGSPAAQEEFSCAAGPTGWRYVATVRDPDGHETGHVDLVLNAGGRQVRLIMHAGGWEVRGGAAGPETLWIRRPAAAAGAEGVEFCEAASGFTGRSPAFLVATVRLLRLSAGARARLRLVEVSEPALGARVVEQGWTLGALTEYPAEDGALPVARYEVADLGSGESREVYVAGDVVVAASGLELTALHSPPTL